jgi:hypothetical protein
MLGHISVRPLKYSSDEGKGRCAQPPNATNCTGLRNLESPSSSVLLAVLLVLRGSVKNGQGCAETVQGPPEDLLTRRFAVYKPGKVLPDMLSSCTLR